MLELLYYEELGEKYVHEAAVLSGDLEEMDKSCSSKNEDNTIAAKRSNRFV